jgi:hypothetical protein
MDSLNKKQLVCLFLLPLIALNAFDIKSGKHVSCDLDMVLGTAFIYEATDYPGRGGFTLTDADIKLSGSYDDNLKYSLSLDLSEINSEDYDSVLKNAYFQYNLIDSFRIRLGQSKVPFGIEYDMSSTERVQLYHSQGSDLIAPGRALGITFSGKKIFHHFSYEGGIYNFTSSDESYENDSGHLRASGTVKYDYRNLTVAYEISASTAETFAHGIGINWEHDLPFNHTIALFTEFIEQRYYNYYWNNSLYSCLSYRMNCFEPYIYCDYFDENMGNDGENDILIPGVGFNIYLIEEKLQIRTDLHTEYYYSYPILTNDAFYNNQLTVKCLITL